MWDVESLRLTVFPTAPITEGLGGWWRQVVGESPALESSQPREGIWEQSGPVPDPSLTEPQLVLGAASVRIDWVLRRALALLPPLGLPTLGSLPEAVAAFSPLMREWLTLAPPMHRIAFGAILLLPVRERQEGYTVLSGLLPFPVGGKAVSDFLYQINRGRTVTLDGWQSELNRLSKWSVMQLHRLAIEIPPGLNQMAEVGTACRLEVDINTAPTPERQEIPQQILVPLFDTLVDIGSEIAVRGDIP